MAPRSWLVSALALPLLAAACGGSDKAAPTKKAEAGAPAATGATTAAPATDARAKMITAAIARVPAIRAQVGELRGLPSHDVPADAQSTADFEAFVKSEAAEEMPANVAAQSRALAHLGALEKDVDLVAASIDASVSQAAAYYDPKSKAFHVVMLPDSDQEFDLVSSHELMHAVQDQNFDLTKYLPDDLGDDAANARRFVVEGEATFMMMVYILHSQIPDPFNGPAFAMLTTQIDKLADMDSAALAKMMENAGATDERMKKAQEAAAALPPYVMDPMFDSYMKGARAVIARFKAGGWKAVDDLYKNPPTSTEQMLHADAKLGCKREEPIAVTLREDLLGPDFKKVADGTLGELGTRVYGEVWKLPDPAAFADGWGGDHWLTLEKGGALTTLWATVWDDKDQAKAFADGVNASLATRKVDGQVVVDGTAVDVVIGCKDAACKPAVSALGKLHKRERPAPGPAAPGCPATP